MKNREMKVGQDLEEGIGGGIHQGIGDPDTCYIHQ